MSSNSKTRINQLEVQNDIVIQGNNIDSRTLPHQEQNQITGVLQLMNKMFDVVPKYSYPDSDQDVSFLTTTTTITLLWKKDYEPIQLNFLKDTTIPNVNYITIDYKKHDEDDTKWKNTNLELSKNDVSYTFVSEQGKQEYIKKETDYDFRVYGINHVMNKEPFYLVYENIRLKDAGSPSKPTDINFFNPTYNSFQVSFTTPEYKDKENENQNEPPLNKIKIKYKATDTKRRKEFDGIEKTDFTLETSNINSPITVSDIKIIPGTKYEINEFRFKNEKNENYGENGINEDVDNNTIQLLIPNDDKIGLTNFNVNRANYNKSPSKKNIFIPLKNVSKNNVNYYNVINDEKKSLETNDKVSTFKITNQGNTVIDTSLIKIQFYINEQENTSIIFKGNEDDIYVNFIDISVNSTNKDSYTGDKNQFKGFGLKGTFKFNTLNDCIGKNQLFEPSGNVYTITYKYFDISNNQETEIYTYTDDKYEFYVDDLNGKPEIEEINKNFDISEFRWCYGIPSIYQYKVDVSYKLKNYASKFLPSDKKISTIEISDPTNNYLKTVKKNIFTTEIEDTKQINEELFGIVKNSFFKQNKKIKLSIQGINLNGTHTNNNNNFSIINDETKFIHNDNDSFKTNSVEVLERSYDNIFTFNWNKNYDVLKNTVNYKIDKDTVNTKDFSLNYNQVPFYYGTFNISPDIFRNWKHHKYLDETSAHDYTNLKEQGDTMGDTTYKWILKRFERQKIDRLERKKKVKLTLDDNSVIYDLKALYDNDRIITLASCKINTDNENETYNNIFNKNYTSWLFLYDIKDINYQAKYDDKYIENYYNDNNFNYILNDDKTIELPLATQNTDFFADVFILIGIPIDKTNFKIKFIELLNT